MDNNININKIDESTFAFIDETYDNLSYFDLYGNSVVIFIFLTLLVFIVFSYCKIMQTKEDIANDWTNQRCKPQNMLFAGLITHPEGVSSFQYTSDNFQYCVQSILTNISGFALKPFQTMIESLTKVFENMSNSIQQSREMMNKMRNGVREFSQDVLGRILNIVIPLQKVFISLMDTFQKIQASMTTSLYTMLGTYYTLQALMGAILEMIIKVLVALVIIIVGLWISPFTWPVAASMSAVFLGISVPLAIIVYFMTEVLHIKASAIPKLRCFDEDTPLTMKNGAKIAIKNTQVGDILADGSYITAKITVNSAGLKMYKLADIVVSESHLVLHQGKWIRVSDYPGTTEVKFDKPFLYCLNTSNKQIVLNGVTFSDWDEIDNKLMQLREEINTENLENIHVFLDEGFKASDLVKMRHMQKPIHTVRIGDVLENGAVVYGLVEIETNKLRKYFNKLSNKKPTKLFHLLTTDGNLIVNSANVRDYNYIIDKFII